MKAREKFERENKREKNSPFDFMQNERERTQERSSKGVAMFFLPYVFIFISYLLD